jgi:hypothetical protein
MNHYPHIQEFGEARNGELLRGLECTECCQKIGPLPESRDGELRSFEDRHEHAGYRITKLEVLQRLSGRIKKPFTRDEAKVRLPRIAIFDAEDARMECTLWNSVGVEGERVIAYDLGGNIFGLMFRSDYEGLENPEFSPSWTEELMAKGLAAPDEE